MVKRKTIDDGMKEERVVRRSTRGRGVKEEEVVPEKTVRSAKAVGVRKGRVVKDEEGEEGEEKVWIIFLSCY